MWQKADSNSQASTAPPTTPTSSSTGEHVDRPIFLVTRQVVQKMHPLSKIITNKDRHSL
jgi:hypothetical protein